MTRRLLMTADAIGGVWQYATGLARDLVRAGWTVDVAVLGPPCDPAQRALVADAGATLIDTGLPLDWLADDTAAVEASAAGIAQLARTRGADLVQLNQPALAVGAFDVPVVAVVHSCVASWWDAVERGPLPAGLAWQTDLVARGLARADAVVCPTRAFAATVARRYALAAGPVTVHNGRSLPQGTGAIADAAFTAGRLWDRGKNVATLDRAAGRLDIPFVAAGPIAGPHGERVATENLRLPGRLDDAAVATHLSARPIFVSAARYEPFGLAVLEAALAGCALVLSDIPTFRELWDGVATFVPATDDAGFVRAIAEQRADPVLRAARGALARRRALTYAPDRQARAMLALFDRLSAAPGRVAA